MKYQVWIPTFGHEPDDGAMFEATNARDAAHAGRVEVARLARRLGVELSAHLPVAINFDVARVAVLGAKPRSRLHRWPPTRPRLRGREDHHERHRGQDHQRLAYEMRCRELRRARAAGCELDED